mgnify:CR=1 FL=1
MSTVAILAQGTHPAHAPAGLFAISALHCLSLGPRFPPLVAQGSTDLLQAKACWIASCPPGYRLFTGSRGTSPITTATATEIRPRKAKRRFHRSWFARKKARRGEERN